MRGGLAVGGRDERKYALADLQAARRLKSFE